MLLLLSTTREYCLVVLDKSEVRIHTWICCKNMEGEHPSPKCKHAISHICWGRWSYSGSQMEDMAFVGFGRLMSTFQFVSPPRSLLSFPSHSFWSDVSSSICSWCMSSNFFIFLFFGISHTSSQSSQLLSRLSNPFRKHICEVSILGCLPKHTPVKYRHTCNTSNRTRHAYLMLDLGHTSMCQWS